MPRQKDLKRLVRKRMQKTGESYTAARKHLLEKKKKRQRQKTGRSGLAKRAGMSDEAVKEKTGRTWDQWVRALDRHRAHEKPHREIANLVRDRYGIGPWWRQMVTVGYERIKGLRERGQRRGGSYEASKSKTFNVPVDELYRAWADPKVRRRWLPGAGLRVRTKTSNRSIRLGGKDGTIVACWFTRKGPAKSAVSVQQGKLPDTTAVERVKRYWADRLEALAGIL